MFKLKLKNSSEDKKIDNDQIIINFNDQSIQALLGSNLLVIVLALIFGFNLAELVWIYFLQNLIIGYYNFKRIRLLKNFATDGFTMNDRPVPETPEARDKTAFFFLAHYGFFHIGYLLFLTDGHNLNSFEIATIFISATVFLFNHRYSFQINHQRDLAGKPNIGIMMFLPYLRVVPMHLITIFGFLVFANSVAALMFFTALKTAADVLLHVIEHRIMQKKSSN